MHSKRSACCSQPLSLLLHAQAALAVQAIQGARRVLHLPADRPARQSSLSSDGREEEHAACAKHVCMLLPINQAAVACASSPCRAGDTGGAESSASVRRQASEAVQPLE